MSSKKVYNVILNVVMMSKIVYNVVQKKVYNVVQNVVQKKFII
jgi:hypothetical protein